MCDVFLPDGNGVDLVLAIKKAAPVSYTHLDVYKRQTNNNTRLKNMDMRKVKFAMMILAASLLTACGSSKKEPVSYTHLDVYKRQGLRNATGKDSLHLTQIRDSLRKIGRAHV